MGTQEREDILNSSAFSDDGFVMSAVTMVDGVPAQVPPSVGRLAAYKRTRAAGGASKSDEYTPLTLRDCSSLLDASDLEASSDTYQDAAKKGAAYCVDPKDFKLSQYRDLTYAGEYQQVEVRFELCKKANQPGVNCLTDA